MTRILCLSGWYPSLSDPTLALFAPSHFKALGLCASLRVLYVVKDKALCGEKKRKVEIKMQENYEEIIVYFKAPQTGLAWVDKPLEQLFKIYHQFRLSLSLIQQEKPDLLLYYITQNNSAIALLHSYLYRLPFATFEHWSGFLPKALMHFRHLPWFYRMTWRWAHRRAHAVLSVSSYLQAQLLQLDPVSQAPHQVVPNTVDSRFFYYSPQVLDPTFTLTLITRKGWEKNLEDSLEALDRVRKQGIALKVHLIGITREDLPIPMEHALQNHLHCWGQLSAQPIGAILRASHVSVLYSRYETFGCAIIESLACGTPVLVSDRAPLQDFIAQGVNGLKVKPEQPQALAQALLDCQQGLYAWDSAKISKDCLALYGLEAVGQQLCQHLARLV
jgi:glycosyltransferase involved in cell wall biosynthesis